MTMETIPTSTHRDVFHQHHEVCRPCSELFSFARSRGDPRALDAWRTQLAVHLANDVERRDFDRAALHQLIVSRSAKAWTAERLAAFRKACRENEVA